MGKFILFSLRKFLHHQKWTRKSASLAAILLIVLLFIPIGRYIIRPLIVTFTTHIIWPSNDNSDNTLYIIGSASSTGDAQVIDRHVTAVDSKTKQVQYIINEGNDGIIVDQQSRLYISEPDRLIAIDTQTGREIWRTAISNRMDYLLDLGPSVMAISPDTRWLYLFSKDYTKSSPEVTYWLQIVDTKQGKVLPKKIPLPECSAIVYFITPSSGEDLYILCNDILILNTYAQRIEQRIRIPSEDPVVSPDERWLYGASLSYDGRWLYIVSANGQFIVVDVKQHNIAKRIDTYRTRYLSVLEGLIITSPDKKKLVVGRIPMSGAGSEIHVFDTETWQEIGKFQLNQGIRPYSLAFYKDNNSVYAITIGETAEYGESDTIVKIDLTNGRVSTQHSIKHENITRIIIGP